MGMWLSWLKRYTDNVKIPGSNPGMPTASNSKQVIISTANQQSQLNYLKIFSTYIYRYRKCFK